MLRPDQSELLCSAVVRQLTTDNHWQLLPEDEFIDAVRARVSPGQVTEREDVRKWSINVYCRQALYPACLGTQGPGRQKRGFEELAFYLYRLARVKWPKVAEDATQEALVMIYSKVENCRKPGAFLAFAIQQLRDAARKIMKAEARADSLDELLAQDFYGDASADEGFMVNEETSVEASAIDADLRQRVGERIQQIKDQNPRARRQLDAVWLRYFQELSNEEIAEVLETRPENVSVLINRGLSKLRQDDHLQTLTEEMIHSPPDTFRDHP